MLARLFGKNKKNKDGLTPGRAYVLEDSQPKLTPGRAYTIDQYFHKDTTPLANKYFVYVKKKMHANNGHQAWNYGFLKAFVNNGNFFVKTDNKQFETVLPDLSFTQEKEAKTFNWNDKKVYLVQIIDTDYGNSTFETADKPLELATQCYDNTFKLKYYGYDIHEFGFISASKVTNLYFVYISDRTYDNERIVGYEYTFTPVYEQNNTKYIFHKGYYYETKLQKHGFLITCSKYDLSFYKINHNTISGQTPQYIDFDLKMGNQHVTLGFGLVLVNKTKGGGFSTKKNNGRKPKHTNTGKKAFVLGRERTLFKNESTGDMCIRVRSNCRTRRFKYVKV